MSKTRGFTFLMLLALFGLFGVSKAQAGSTHNIVGWLWGGSDDGAGQTTGLGWVSLNSANCDVDGDGAYEGVTEGAPAGCPSAGQVANAAAGGWGVNIPIDGSTPASGYAWSENVGWISFHVSDLTGCPSGICNARMEGSNLKGWARIMSITQVGPNSNGGWEGWISLSGSNYGVSLVGQNFSGLAWSNELGWIDFSRASVAGLPVITFSASPLIINVDSNPLPQNTTLTWSVNGATSCTASSTNGAWTGAKDATSGSETAQITEAMPSVKFTLTCQGLGGQTTASADVTTVCNEHSCDAGSCKAIPKFGIPRTASCTLQNCTNDSQCEAVSTGIWKEVTP